MKTKKNTEGSKMRKFLGNLVKFEETFFLGNHQKSKTP